MSIKELQNTTAQRRFWEERYRQGRIGWDIGYPSTPLQTYFDQLEDKTISILIPGAGNGHEVAYLWQRGFDRVYLMDIALTPLETFARQHRDFPTAQLLHENFFTHQGQYDLIIEQTFFCSFPPQPENRHAYAGKMLELLKPGGKLVGLWFTFPLREGQGQPPYGGSRKEYLKYFSDRFICRVFEPAYNSIKPRMGNELFGIWQKP